jgi:hypothetical protein
MTRLCCTEARVLGRDGAAKPLALTSSLLPCPPSFRVCPYFCGEEEAPSASNVGRLLFWRVTSDKAFRQHKLGRRAGISRAARPLWRGVAMSVAVPTQELPRCHADGQHVAQTPGYDAAQRPFNVMNRLGSGKCHDTATNCPPLPRKQRRSRTATVSDSTSTPLPPPRPASSALTEKHWGSPFKVWSS